MLFSQKYKKEKFEEIQLTVNKDSRSIKIGLMSPFGLGNLGDAAIQQAMIQNIRKYYPNAEIYGFSLNPKDTEESYGISAFPMCNSATDQSWLMGNGNNSVVRFMCQVITWINAIPNSRFRKLAILLFRVPLQGMLEPLALIRAYRRVRSLDLFIVSGGGQLDDYWGGAWQNPYALMMWAILTKLSLAKFAIVSVGAAPINAFLSRVFIKISLYLADYRSYRDKDSKLYIENVVGFYRNDLIYPDLAHSLDVTNYKRELASPQVRQIIGIGPMPYFDPRIWPENSIDIYWSYLKKLSEFVTWLINKNYDILFIPGEINQDKTAIEDLKGLLQESHVLALESRLFEENISTVDQLMTQLKNTDMVVASRFHGVLLAQLLNKPVLALSYHRKIDALMANMGHETYCLSIDNFNVKDLKEKFSLLETEYDQAKRQLEQKTSEYRALLNKQYEDLFKELY